MIAVPLEPIQHDRQESQLLFAEVSLPYRELTSIEEWMHLRLFKKAAVRRQFPAQFLSRTFEEIQIAARANEPGARKVLKLLLNRRFDQ